MQLKSLSLVLISLTWVGCGDEKFSRGTDKAPLAAENLRLDCSSRSKTVSLGDNQPIVIEGEVCKQAQLTNERSVFHFIIDTSESMRINDPSTIGSCGRLDAVRSMLNRLKSKASNLTTPPLVSMVTFDSNAQVILAPTRINDINETQLNSLAICSARGHTNYQAAFSVSQSILQGVRQASIAFVTDGVPTRDQFNQSSLGGSVPQQVYQSGLNALNSLKDSITTFEFNAIYLEPQFGSAGDSALMNARSYLNQLVNVNDGSNNGNRLRSVNSADQLETALLDLDEEYGNQQNQGRITRKIQNSNGTSQSVPFIIKDETSNGYRFQSQKFVPKTGSNTFEFEGKTYEIIVSK